MATPTYWDYLQLEQLLSLQGGLEGDETQLMPDELHFIIVHQVFELWFKLILRELRLARDHLAAPRVPEERVPYVVHHLRRVNQILRLAVDQFQVMETLTPQDFLAFRDKLVPASGFQSYQMRELELVLGLTEEARPRPGKFLPLDHIRTLAQGSPGGEAAWGRVRGASEELTLRAALHAWLYRTPIQGSSPDEPGDTENVGRFVDAYLSAIGAQHARQAERLGRSLGEDQSSRSFESATALARAFFHAEDVPEPARPKLRRVRAALVFIESYRELPLLAWPRLLVDTVVELEELLVLWRTRHARMVERVIGRRVGTGGSAGVDYLDETTRVRIFTELWTVRTLLLPKEALPSLESADAYGFAR